MEETGNIIHLRGQICQSLQFGHELFGEQFYVTTLRVPRLSGAEDFLPITISERLLIDEPLTAGSMLCMEGQLRSYNKVIEGAGRLLITAFAQRILNCEEDEENPNRVQLTGALCKEPNLRITPMGRDICDLMLAVNRRYGRSDYLPCICWGLKAREAATWMVGTQVKLEGRIQSRRYIKMTEDGPVERTAFEVSVIQAEAVTAALKTEALQ